MAASRPDLIILGGGLAGGLCALALAARRPELRVTIVEEREQLGGNHLWSFFGDDVAPRNHDIVEPLVGHRWDGYDVRFPAHRRVLSQPYRTVRSEALDAAVRAAGVTIVRGHALAASPHAVALGDGSILEGHAVIDCGGLSGPPDGLDCGWQKFVGQSLVLSEPHGLTRPLVMDATVSQMQGYRFIYCLPFSPTELFVEDTYYSDTSTLDRDRLSGHIADYAAAQGWRVTAIEREERGVLPVVMGGDFDRFWPKGDPVARGGTRAALFHPLTSYSLPDAVRHAAWLARVMPLGGEALGQASRMRAEKHWSRHRFDRMLARMLFKAADPHVRYRILERFYRLPEPLIARFYAGRPSTADKARILAGKPPVPVARALKAILESS